MKKPISKAQIRRDLDKQISDFVDQGGTVSEIPRGQSGREPGDGPLKASNHLFDQAKTSRTYVPEVVAALDARKKPQKTAKPKSRRPRKKIIYDDFGEPLRWEWEE